MISHAAKYFLTMSRLNKTLTQIVFDFISILFCYAFILHLTGSEAPSFLGFSNLIAFFATSTMTLSLFWAIGLYRTLVRHTSLYNILYIARACFFGTGIFFFIFLFNHNIGTALSIAPIYFSLLVVVSASGRILLLYSISKISGQLPQHIGIYGADKTGQKIAKDLRENSKFKPVFFIDDNPKLKGSVIGALEVVSSSQLEEFCLKNSVTSIIIGTSKISEKGLLAISEIAAKLNIFLKVQRHEEFLGNAGRATGAMKNLDIYDILERKTAQPDQRLISKNIHKKNVMVTGGGGSIGSEICSIVLRNRAKTLIILDNCEFNLYEVNEKILKMKEATKLDVAIKLELCDVSNVAAVTNVMHKYEIDTIFHAAALKHVPLMENNATQCIKTNVFGTKLLADLAVKSKVESFILVSTDKAVRPTSIMGASKRLAELICQSYEKHAEKTVFSAVRFGNVLGSSGSVIPLFQNQILEGGPVTVTEKRVERFMMTISEAAQLVIQAGAMAHGNEIFVLKMGNPVQIDEVARKMVLLYGFRPFSYPQKRNTPDDIEIKYIGLRPGEKLSEELFITGETKQSQHEKIIITIENKITSKDLTRTLKQLEKQVKSSDDDGIIRTLEDAAISYKHVSNDSNH